MADYLILLWKVRDSGEQACQGELLAGPPTLTRLEWSQ
jgi:hypothetical protein